MIPAYPNKILCSLTSVMKKFNKVTSASNLPNNTSCKVRSTRLPETRNQKEAKSFQIWLVKEHS